MNKVRVAIYTTDDERKAWQAAADSLGIDLPNWIRLKLREAHKHDQPAKRGKAETPLETKEELRTIMDKPAQVNEPKPKPVVNRTHEDREKEIAKLEILTVKPDHPESREEYEARLTLMSQLERLKRERLDALKPEPFVENPEETAKLLDKWTNMPDPDLT